jgi:hypothetical protein
MCFSSPSPPPPQQIAPAPPPAAPPSANPVMTNMYDPSSPESGQAAELGAAANAAAGTSQLKIPLDPTVQNMGTGTGLQITQ